MFTSKVPMQGRALLAILMLMPILSASAIDLSIDPVPQGALTMHWIEHTGGASGARTLMLIVRGVDPAEVDGTTLHEIGALLDSADPLVISYAVKALRRIGPRALPYTGRLQQIVVEEHCNITGIGRGDVAASALEKIGIPARPHGCRAWEK